MIYQVCDLDNKKPHPNRMRFLYGCKIIALGNSCHSSSKLISVNFLLIIHSVKLYQHFSTIAVQVVYQRNINTLINNKQEQSIKRLLLFYYKPMLNAISNKPIK